ncbi:hypothetical protein GPLA_4180 [Paraglaciecola polaris LMG 21857]|uniref:Uncharacterized protein n=1 Tax=Paraglaciecola polaris LMG 21857 TaxID=1129793 RepID=K6YQP3_9ALTE|nr:hypothetical protein GPLA_4180 [Paraglaciecola polaris LMG 21857]
MFFRTSDIRVLFIFTACFYLFYIASIAMISRILSFQT